MEVARKDPVPDESSLVDRLRAGDTAALDALIRIHAGWAQRFAVRLLGDADAAEDVVQEAFVRIFRAASAYRGTSAFRTYLYRVLLNRCRDHAAARKRRETMMERIAEAVATDEPRSENPAAQAGAREFEVRLRGMVEGLPPAQRETLVLRAWEGLPYEEIARVLDVTVHAVKANLAEARSKVASWLGGRRQ